MSGRAGTHLSALLTRAVADQARRVTEVNGRIQVASNYLAPVRAQYGRSSSDGKSSASRDQVARFE